MNGPGGSGELGYGWVPVWVADAKTEQCRPEDTVGKSAVNGGYLVGSCTALKKYSGSRWFGVSLRGTQTGHKGSGQQ